jgi:Lipoxygenase
VVDAPARQEGEDGGLRIRRRGFVGAGLAAAGAALLPHASTATAKPGPPTGRQGDSQPSVPSPAPAAHASGPGSLPQMPLRSSYPNLPAIPVDADGALDTLGRLAIRSQQAIQAKQGLNHRFKIGGVSRTAYAFLYGGPNANVQLAKMEALAKTLREQPERAPPILAEGAHRRAETSREAASGTPVSLESPEQFSISWTNFPDIYETGRPLLSKWASSLTDADEATKQFWPMIAEHGYGFNLIVPERVTSTRAKELRKQLGSAWTQQVRSALAAGNLYVIDLSRFESLQPQVVDGAPRFTPATVTLLIRNARTKSLTPVAIIVSGYQGRDRRVFRRDTAADGAWLYALQAAKASVTLFGVWLGGHVYSWHIVTCAMQMTMFNTLPTTHHVYQLLAPQSKFAIPFDDVLLGLWSQIAPPTSLTSAGDFFALANDYADGRNYFDDDPTTTIEALGLRQRDWTAKTAWDKYPVVQRLLQVWGLVENYVDRFVDATYASDAAVAADGDLQTWIATAASSDPTAGGNVRGLPAVNTRSALTNVLRSLLYRITVHGISRLTSTTNPAATFVANYPHCLQRTDIPSPRSWIGTKKLLSYLPNTDTIAQALNFYYTFAFSTPYEAFVPLGGINTELFFPAGPNGKPNRALIELRNGLASFIDDYQPDMPQRFQWPRNIET